MNNMRKLLAVTFCIFALAGCGKKPVYHTAPAQPSAPSQASASEPSTAAMPTLAGCSLSLPDKVAVQRAIEKAMKQIYGLDAGPQKITVLKTAAAEDCEHITVTYRSQAAGSSPQTSPMVADGGKWSVTLFGKQYPID
jgi:predicted small lipoprotein YifL